MMQLQICSTMYGCCNRKRHALFTCIQLTLFSFLSIMGAPQCQSQQRQKVQLAALRISKGQELETIKSTHVFLLDGNGNDVSKSMLPNNSQCQTDDKGVLDLTIPPGDHCYVVTDEISEGYGNDPSKLSIPSITLVSATDSGVLRKSIVSRNLDCMRTTDAIAELTHIHALIAHHDKADALGHFRKQIASSIALLGTVDDALEDPPVTQSRFVDISFSTHLLGNPINLFKLPGLLPPSIELSQANWAILDAWGGIVAQGTTETTKNGMLSVQLLPGRLYSIVIAPNRSVENVVVPPTYAILCPSSGSPVTIAPQHKVKFDKNVPIFFPSMNEEGGLNSHLLRMQELISKAVSETQRNDLPIIRIDNQIRELLNMIRRGQAFADLRDTQKPFDVFVHLVKAAPSIDNQWSLLHATAMKSQHTKFWAICDTTNKDSFSQYFAKEKNGSSLDRFQILGYLPFVRNNGAVDITFTEQQLIVEAQQWRRYGVRGVFIDFFDPSKMTNLGAYLKQENMIVIAHVRQSLNDESAYSNPFVDGFFLSQGMTPDYLAIRNLTRRQLLPPTDAQAISSRMRFGALDRSPTNAVERASAFEQMVESRCSMISIGSPELMFDANQNPVFRDQNSLVGFWEDLVQHTEQYNLNAKKMWESLVRSKLLSVPKRK